MSPATSPATHEHDAHPGECRGRFLHSWFVGRFGGITCGRCGARRSAFCMVDGRPVPVVEA